MLTEDGIKNETGERSYGITVQEDAGRYLRARLILGDLKDKYRAGKITFEQYHTIRGQALGGDVNGAVKGLAKVLRKNQTEEKWTVAQE